MDPLPNQQIFSLIVIEQLLSFGTNLNRVVRGNVFVLKLTLAVEAGLYLKAVEMCSIANTTTQFIPSPF